VTPLADEPPALLNAFLAERDVPCPRCGYNLRSLVGRRCPECGDELTLRIGLVEPRAGAYMTALAASCFGVGGAGLFCALALSAAPASFWDEPAAKALLVMLAVSSTLLTAVLVKRRAFRLLSPRVQWTLAAIACVLVSGLAVLVVALFED
jgi:hypothetical protein